MNEEPTPTGPDWEALILSADWPKFRQAVAFLYADACNRVMMSSDTNVHFIAVGEMRALYSVMTVPEAHAKNAKTDKEQRLKRELEEAEYARANAHRR